MFIVDSLGLNPGPPDLKFTGCHHDNQPGLLWGLCSQRSRDGRDRAEQNKRVVFRRQKTAALPELRRLRIDGIDHQRASAHELSSLDGKPFFSGALMLEVPIAGLMGVVGGGLAEWWGLSGMAAGAVIAVVGYIGPPGIEVVFAKVVELGRLGK